MCRYVDVRMRRYADMQMRGCAEYLFGPPITDAGRVAPISACVLCLSSCAPVRFVCRGKKKPLSVVTLKEAVKIKLAATYSPAGVQYHRRGWA